MNSRLKGLDLYRIIGCAFVIVNHCNSKVLLHVTPKSLAWFVTVGVIYITKITVPGFFMITGYNLLHRREGASVYFKRIRRMLAVLLIFSLLYYIVKCASGAVAPSAEMPVVLGYIWGYLKVLWHNGAADAFWYLYTYIGLLIMMPLLQAAAAHMSEYVEGSDGSCAEGIIIAASALIITCVLPAIRVFAPAADITPYFELPMICVSTVYLFLGHLIYLKRDRLGAGQGIRPRDMWLIGGFILGFALNMLTTVSEYRYTAGESFLSYSEINMPWLMIESVAVFIFLLKLRGDGRIGRFIGVIAPLTFGIYLLADLMCSWTHMIYYVLSQHTNRLLAVAVQEAAAFILACIAVFLIRLIPAARKMV